MFLQIFNDLKEKYSKQDLSYLPLVAVACFLINKGCDWTAKNKKGRTAADKLPWLPWKAFDCFFKEECDNYHMFYVMKKAQGTRKCLVVGNRLYGPDSNGCMSSVVLEGIYIQ